MFEASVKARQFERGQTIEGTVVAFGPEVAFIDVGGKAEAEIDLAELKDADGDIEVSVGDRIQAMVVSTSRSEEHTSELQSRLHLVCRLLLEKKKNKYNTKYYLT